MNILHIANYFSGSAVFKNLFKSIDSIDIEQCVYNAVRSESLIGNNEIEFDNYNSKIIYSKLLNTYTRINFYAKVRRIFNDIEDKIDITKYNIIHAHTWFSDGAVAYELYKKYKIPYIVTVRNTDLNFFYKYMFHLRSYGMRILSHAHTIVFITPAYQKRLVSKVEKDILLKSIIIPNGIDSYWLKNINEKKIELYGPFNILYIGTFTKGKNVKLLIQAVSLLRKSGFDFYLNIIGAGGSQEAVIKKNIADKHWIKYHGKINAKDELRTEFRNNHIFAMPSKSETFGLVYIEALTQGLPVIYSKNEGIDGLHNSNIGEAVKSSDVYDIAKGLKNIYLNYSFYNFEIEKIIKHHNWDHIAQNYLNIYKEIIK